MYQKRKVKFTMEWWRLGMALLFMCMLLFGVGTEVWARDDSIDNLGNFDINAEVLGHDRDSYNVQVTIQNNGPDWEGTVRLMPTNAYFYAADSAYDTEISLPQGSRKQFTMQVGTNYSTSYTSSSSQAGALKIYLLDKKDRSVAKRQFDHFFTTDTKYLNLGILSDDYSSLTYLDLGGEELYIDGDMYPIKLKKLEQADLKEGLDELDYLVIDQYNTGSLKKEEIQAISDWNYDGGILVVGTGAYAKEVLAGLEDYLEIKCKGVYGASEDSEEWEESDLQVADLQDVYNRYYDSYYSSMALNTYQGDGAIAVLPFALSDLGKIRFSYYQYGYTSTGDYVRNLLTDAYNYASVRYKTGNYSDNTRYSTRIMKFWGNSSNALNFTLLKLIVFLYVIFVGPILYLILKVAKKKELYWVCVPVTTLCAVGLVFLAGRGFKMVDTTVFSVTLENLAGRGKTTSYLYCYDANHREWDLKLADGYDFVNGYSDGYSYRYYSEEEEDGYYYHVQKKGEDLHFGIRPESSFEDCFFIAQRDTKRDPDLGQIVCQNVQESAVSWFNTPGQYGQNTDDTIVGWYQGNAGAYGQITNETGEDFAYYAVLFDDSVYVYGELRAGESSDLATANPIYRGSDSYSLTNEFLYDCLDDDNRRWDDKQIGQLSAIGMAIAAFDTDQYANKVVVIGVTKSGDKVVDDRCDEAAYKCLYVVE